MDNKTRVEREGPRLVHHLIFSCLPRLWYLQIVQVKNALWLMATDPMGAGSSSRGRMFDHNSVLCHQPGIFTVSRCRSLDGRWGAGFGGLVTLGTDSEERRR